MRSRDWEITRIPDEIARKLDDAVKPVDFPAKPAYFRSSVVSRCLNLLHSSLSLFICSRRQQNTQNKEKSLQATDGAPKCFWRTRAIVPRNLGWVAGSVGTTRVVACVNERLLTISLMIGPILSQTRVTSPMTTMTSGASPVTSSAIPTPI